MPTKQHYESEAERAWDLAINPPPQDDSGPKYDPPVTVVYRDRPLDFSCVLTWMSLAFLAGAFLGGFWVAISLLGEF